VDLFDNGVVDEAPELPHQPPVQATIVFVLRLVYHVEIADD
jgi:hypothetical protein